MSCWRLIERYVPVIGTRPGPMLDDYAARIAADQVWVLEDGGSIAGVLVLEDGPENFLLDNIAVRPDRQGSGFGRRLLDVRRSRGDAVRMGHDHTVHQCADDREYRDLRATRLRRTGAADGERIRPGLHGEGAAAAGLNIAVRRDGG